MQVKTVLSLLTFSIVLNMGINAQNELKKQEVETIGEFQNLFHYQQYYIAGQPSLDALKWLRSQGVSKVINLRSETENEDFKASSFDEHAVVEELGMEYHSIPVSGREGYSPKNLAKMGELIDDDEKVLIHCAGAGRATSFLMGFLVQFRDYTLDEAVDAGQEMTFFFPLEALLDTEITMKTKPDIK
jgi:protein tyrosine phosphatase (PTP) superfamily phosphohydrolase (DUF442 family)